MKTLLAILLFAASTLAQTPQVVKPAAPQPAAAAKPAPPPGKRILAPPTRLKSVSAPHTVFTHAVINVPFSQPVPALSGETGCSLQILAGPKLLTAQTWKLANGAFSGTTTIAGFYRLKISCSTPAAVAQSIFLSVARSAPVAKPAAPAPPSIPLN